MKFQKSCHQDASVHRCVYQETACCFHPVSFTVIEEEHKGGSAEIFPLNPFGAANMRVGFGMMKKIHREELRLCYCA